MQLDLIVVQVYPLFKYFPQWLCLNKDMPKSNKIEGMHFLWV